MTPPKPPLPMTRATLLAWYVLLIAGIPLPPLWIVLGIWATVVMRRHGRNKRALEAQWREERRVERVMAIKKLLS